MEIIQIIIICLTSYYLFDKSRRTNNIPSIRQDCLFLATNWQQGLVQHLCPLFSSIKLPRLLLCLCWDLKKYLEKTFSGSCESFPEYCMFSCHVVSASISATWSTKVWNFTDSHSRCSHGSWCILNLHTVVLQLIYLCQVLNKTKGKGRVDKVSFWARSL